MQTAKGFNPACSTPEGWLEAQQDQQENEKEENAAGDPVDDGGGDGVGDLRRDIDQEGITDKANDTLF